MPPAPLAPAVEGLPHEDTLNLYDYWCVLVRRRMLILRCVVAFMALTVLIVLWLPNVYKSTATLRPMGSQGNSLLATLSDLGGVALPSGAKPGTPSDHLLAILQSRTMAMDVIRHLNLLPVLFVSDWNSKAQQWKTAKPPTLQDAVRALGAIVSFSVNKQDVLSITVECTDPVLAAAIANRHIKLLQQALNDNAFSLAKKNRLLIASRLDEARQDLEQAEEVLKQFEQTYKIINIETQAETAVKALATLEEQIIGREVQLGVQQRLLKGASREVYLLEEELRGLRSQMARLHHGSPEELKASHMQPANSRLWIAVDEAPEVRLTYTRLQREAQLQAKLFILLTQQLEQAKIEETRDETAFQVLDHALPADRKSKPRGALLMAVGTVGGVFFGVLLAFVRESFDRAIKIEGQVEPLVGLPLLATIPAFPQHEQRYLYVEAPLGRVSRPMALPLHMPTTEAVRYLYTRLRHLNGQQRLQTVLLASVEPDDNTAYLLVQLALVAASGGKRTLLIDTNLQHPTLHRLLQRDAVPGLAEMLATPESSQQSIQPTEFTNLYLLAAGAAASATLASLDTPAFDTLLTHCKTVYDLILCTAPVLPRYTDAAVLGNKVDVTCLVLTCGVSRIETILEAKNLLEAVQANVTGVILTACP